MYILSDVIKLTASLFISYRCHLSEHKSESQNSLLCSLASHIYSFFPSLFMPRHKTIKNKKTIFRISARAAVRTSSGIILFSQLPKIVYVIRCIKKISILSILWLMKLTKFFNREKCKTATLVKRIGL